MFALYLIGVAAFFVLFWFWTRRDESVVTYHKRKSDKHGGVNDDL